MSSRYFAGESTYSQFAKQRGFTIVRDFVLSESAFTGAHRGQLAEALANAGTSKSNRLLCWSLDRLSRKGSEALLGIGRRFRERGARVISLQEPWTDAGGEALDLLLAICGLCCG